MKQSILTAIITVLAATFCFGQELSQTIRGTVIDNDSKMPLPGASVIIPNSAPFRGTCTDANGSFRLPGITIGRTSVQVSYIGYETVTIPNIEINTGREVVLTVTLQESAVRLNEVVIKTDRKKGDAINEMAQLSIHSITPDETKRFTGGMDDPARVVSCYAGVASTPDGSSDIIVRGNSPKYMQWRLEGNEISSPYHMDDQNSSFGALTALNNNLMTVSDFYTGAFPAEYGNVIASIYDVKLRTGNNERFEASAGIGIMGTELTLEGPFKMEYTGSYLFNFRFSTISLVKKMGLVDVEGGVNYQDATLKIVLPTRKSGTFTLYALGGKSGVSMENMGPDGLSVPGSPLSNALISKDLYKSNYLINAGINHVLTINSKSSLRSSVSMSGTGADDDVYQSDTIRLITPGGEPAGDSVSGRTHTIRSRIVNSTLRASVRYLSKLSKADKLQTGVKYTRYGFNNRLSMFNDELSAMTAINDFNISISAMDAFVSWKHSFNDKVVTVAGLHSMILPALGAYTLEPRVSMTWNISKKSSMHAGYGLHSTLERIHNYYTRIPQPDGGYTEPNKNLGLLKAHHFVLGFEKRFSKHLLAKIEVYYQYLWDLPVENDSTSSYCTINEGIDYNYVPLVNKGIGKNYGAEISVERFFDNNFYFLVNASVFDSKCKTLENVWRNTRYNNNFIVNVLGGKEFRNIGKKHNQTLALNVKLFFEGGERYIPLLRDAQGNVSPDPVHNRYFDNGKAYEKQLDNIFTVNLSASYKFNRPKVTHEIFLDLMNVTNNKARMGEYYDANKPDNVGYATQFGFFPNLVYRFYF